MTNRNENRPGYMKTKAGWLPVEWEVIPAGEVFDIQLGKMLSKKARSGNNLQPYLANYNVQWGAFDLSKIQKMNFSDREMKKFLLKKKDLLVCEGGEVGRCAVWNEQIYPCFYQKALHRVRPKIEEIDVYYIMYYVHLTSNSSRMVHYKAQTSISHFTREQFLKFPIALPPFPEQKKIAEILSTWDTAIEQTRKLIDAKKRLKKALMQHLPTGKIRLSGFKKYKDKISYRFFDLLADWECSRIKEIAEECSERNTTREKLTVLSCSKHLGLVESSEYFGKQVFSGNTSNYKIIRRGCFGYPSNPIEEGSIGLLLNHDMGIVSPIYTVFKCNDLMVPEYLYALFKTETYRHIFSISTNASVDRRGSLRWHAFSLIQVPNPTKEEQLAIVVVLKTADNEINQLNKKLKALEKKRGLMQKLLTGEIRVR